MSALPSIALSQLLERMRERSGRRIRELAATIDVELLTSTPEAANAIAGSRPKILVVLRGPDVPLALEILREVSR